MDISKYQKGQIYKIVDVGYNRCYIGSICESLSKRMARHRTHYNSLKKGKRGHAKSFDIFEEYGIENCKIEWIEDYPCDTKKELKASEGFSIPNLECVNRIVVGRTPQQYQQQNADSVKAYKICKQQWYEKKVRTADKAKEDADVKESCVCGSTYILDEKNTHSRTKSKAL